VTNREIIVQTLEWMEAHLHEDLTVTALSQRAGYSLYHFIRLFQGVIGYTPKEYIMRRKLTEAAKELLDKGRKVSDVAFDYCFKDHETFTRAFKRFFGISPAELKSGAGIATPFFEMSQEVAMRGASPKFLPEPEVVMIDGFSIIGLPGYARLGESLDGIWSAFQADVHSIRQRKMPERFCQLAFWHESDEIDGFSVMPAVEVTHLKEIPFALVGKTVPDGLYLRFIHRGPTRTIGETYNRIYESYLPQSVYKLTMPFNFERYDRCGSGNAKDSEVDIFIPLEIFG
jgi:AraC family transcriptional regulator